jgi:hypothetical protein
MTHRQESTGISRGSAWRRWWSIGAAALGAMALAWVLWRVDYPRMAEVLASAQVPFLLLLPLAAAAEQLARAWKWRQLLHDIRPIGTWRLFGAIMAGYFANVVVPLGISPFVRSWLIARIEALRMSTVLATAAIDRLVDGVVFTAFVALALGLIAFPDPTGNIRLGLAWGGAGSLVLFVLLLWGLARYKLSAGRPESWILRLCGRLPARWSDSVKGVGQSFAEGIVWPRQAWRGASVVLASIVIKVIAISYFLWAGLAFGVVLKPGDYVFLVVFLGFLIILTRLVRIPGGFFFGALFALDLLGVAEEPALAMVLVVQLSSMLTVCAIGALALWRHGVALDELRSAS